MKNNVNKKILFSILLFFLTGTLFALGKPKFDLKSLFTKPDLAALYSELPETTPVVAILPPESTSGVDEAFLEELFQEIIYNMIVDGNFKPGAINKWLAATYGNKKIKSIFELVRDLGRYQLPSFFYGLCKSSVYRIGEKYVINISIYSLTKNGYPISAVRVIDSSMELHNAVKWALKDLSMLTIQKQLNAPHVVFAPFDIQCTTLIEQNSGIFDFVSTPYSNQLDIEIKTTDDFYSNLLAYQAQISGLFNASLINPLKEIITTTGSNVNATDLKQHADYLVKGTVILSNKYDIIKIYLINTTNGETVGTFNYISKTLSVQELFSINYACISDFCKTLLSPEEYVIIPSLAQKDCSYYLNDMYAGSNKLENIPVKTGKITIYTGDSYASNITRNPNRNSKDNINDVYIFTENNKIQIFKGREGEYVWNLLEK
ncbi:MAG: hypothetical protein K6E97_01105 [Treponema sp.]|nr:hypothetical protein [Treponema sp.]